MGKIEISKMDDLKKQTNNICLKKEEREQWDIRNKKKENKCSFIWKKITVKVMKEINEEKYIYKV